MFQSTKRSRRHRNPQPQEAKDQQPFFNKAGKQAVQTKAEPFFQAKLTVGLPGDKYEQEADAVADKVVNGNGQQPAVQQQGISSIQRGTLATPAEDEKLGTAEARMEKDKAIQEKPEVQREGGEEEEPVQAKGEEEEEVQMMGEEEEEPVQTMGEEEEEPVQKMEEEEEPVQAKGEEEEEVQMMGEEEEEPVQTMEEEEPVQAKSKKGASPQASSGLSNKIRSSSGKGNQMPKNTKSEMENSFGVDFSGVNIHTDQSSVEMNKELGAQAFTRGQDVYFNAGKFKPETSEGKRLLAHELTHVVQQGKSGNHVVKRKKSTPTPNKKSKANSQVDALAPSPKDVIQRDIKGSGKVRHGEFKIDMEKQETPAGTKSGEKGTVKFTPNKKSPKTNKIGLVQILKDLDTSKTPPEDYKWPGDKADRNKTMTSASTSKYKTKKNDTLIKISQSQAQGHVTPKEIHDLNKVALGGFDKNKKIAKGKELTIPLVEEGFHIDHKPAHAKASPRANKAAAEVPLYYRDYWPNPADSQDGHKKSKTDIKHASLWDFPGSGGDRRFSFETVARSKDKAFDYGTIHWNFTIKDGDVKNESYHIEKGTSASFKSAIAEFNKFYKNHHTVVKGDTLSGLAKLYYGDKKKWKKIKKANKLKTTIIKDGQKLIIPTITKT